MSKNKMTEKEHTPTADEELPCFDIGDLEPSYPCIMRWLDEEDRAAEEEETK